MYGHYRQVSTWLSDTLKVTNLHYSFTGEGKQNRVGYPSVPRSMGLIVATMVVNGEEYL